MKECEEEDGECDGDVIELTLKYWVSQPVLVTIKQKKGEQVYNSVVNPNQQFTIYGVDKKGTLSPEIYIKLDGVDHTSIHTSCSQTIYPGLVSGDFEVISGKSRNGGLLCPYEEGNSITGDVAGIDIDPQCSTGGMGAQCGDDGNDNGDDGCHCLETEDDFHIEVISPDKIPEFSSMISIFVMLTIIGIEVYILMKKK